MPNYFQVGIYNSAGERVRELLRGRSACVIGELKLNSRVMVDASQPLRIDVSCQISNFQSHLSWDGNNDSGQPVDSGSYFLRSESRDEDNTVSEVIEAIGVLRPRGDATLTVYNAAGEVVYAQPLNGLASAAVGLRMVGDAVVVAPASANQASPQVLSVLLRDAQGNQTPWIWSGVNGQGRPVASGTYTLGFVGADGVVERINFTVLAQAPADPGQSVLAPNPAGAAGAWVYFQARPAARADLFLYNLAGEAVGQWSGEALSGRLNISSDQLASGIYFAVLEISEGGVMTHRLVKKWSVIR